MKKFKKLVIIQIKRRRIMKPRIDVNEMSKSKNVNEKQERKKKNGITHYNYMIKKK